LHKSARRRPQGFEVIHCFPQKKQVVSAGFRLNNHKQQPLISELLVKIVRKSKVPAVKTTRSYGAKSLHPCAPSPVRI
jgi:hypothetical protein